jgi:hypothetical protein
LKNIYLKTEGNSVGCDEHIDVDGISKSNSDDFSSSYIDMEKLDDEKMAELLEDHETALQSDNIV